MIPRYSSKRDFADVEWVDGGWPKMPPMGKPDVSKVVLQEIKKEIKKICKIKTI